MLSLKMDSLKKTKVHTVSEQNKESYPRGTYILAEGDR